MSEPSLGECVVVTGAGSGIGLEIARGFLAAGARVFICDISAETLAQALEANPGLRGSVADIGDAWSVERFFSQAEDELGECEVLVNNAGIGGPRAPLEDISYEDWDRTIGINLSGMFYCTKQVTPAMKERGGGAIINIATASARTGLPFRAPYVASKSGVLGFTYNAARELGSAGIRCNAILPGLVDNPRGRKLVEAQARERGESVESVEAGFLAHVSMRTWIDPSEVAELAVFLASPAARHITGQSIGVCGNLEWEE